MTEPQTTQADMIDWLNLIEQRMLAGEIIHENYSMAAAIRERLVSLSPTKDAKELARIARTGH